MTEAKTPNLTGIQDCQDMRDKIERIESLLREQQEAVRELKMWEKVMRQGINPLLVKGFVQKPESSYYFSVIMSDGTEIKLSPPILIPV